MKYLKKQRLIIYQYFNIKEIYKDIYLCEFDTMKRQNTTLFRIIDTDYNKFKHIKMDECMKEWENTIGKNDNDSFINTFYSWHIDGDTINTFDDNLKNNKEKLIPSEFKFITAIRKLTTNKDIEKCDFIIIHKDNDKKLIDNAIHHELSHILYDNNSKYRAETILALSTTNPKQIYNLYIKDIKSYPFEEFLNEFVAYSNTQPRFRKIEDKYLDKLKI